MRRTEPAGTLVLDSQALSLAVNHRDAVIDALAWARDNNEDVITTSMTVVEATNPTGDRRALQWRMSKIAVEPVTEETAWRAVDLLAEAGKHGHSHAIDAAVCAVALSSRGPVTVLTSDPKDIDALTDGQVSVVPV